MIETENPQLGLELRLRKCTAREERFALAFLETGCLSDAYRCAYSAARMCDHAIRTEASSVAARPQVRARIEALQAAAAARAGLTVDRVIEELMALGLSDIGDVVSIRDGVLTIRDLDAVAPRVRRAVACIKAKVVAVETREEGGGEKRVYEILNIEIRMWDKLTALNALARHLGLFPRDNEQQQAKADELTKLWKMIDGRTRGLPSMHTEPE